MYINIGGNMYNIFRSRNSKETIKLILKIILIITVLFVLGIIVLRYMVEGETNMPFNLSKISIISTSDGVSKGIEGYRWAFDLFQSNDIYLYVEKNESYNKEEAIKNIKLENYNIEKENESNINIYKPELDKEKSLFLNTESNKVNSIIFKGSEQSNLKELTISNQGGITAFRISNDNIVEYKSNDEQINHNELLKKAGINNEQLKFKITFDLIIELESGKEYKSEIMLELPYDDVVNKGTTSIEITDTSMFKFKRIKN